MKNTLQDLKAILDRGGMIQRGEETVVKKTGYFLHHLPLHNDSTTTRWKNLESFITTPSDWTEVKKDIPESSGVSEAFGERHAYIEEVKRNGGFKVVEKREWDAMQKELEELRAKVG